MADFEEQNDEYILHTDRGDIIYQAVNLEGEQPLELMAREILQTVMQLDVIVEELTGLHINPPDIFLFDSNDLSTITHHGEARLGRSYYFITDGGIFLNKDSFLLPFERNNSFYESIKATLVVDLISHLIEHYAVTAEHFESIINTTISHAWEVQCLRTIYEVSEDRYFEIANRNLDEGTPKYRSGIYKVNSVEVNLPDVPEFNLEDVMPQDMFQSHIINWLCSAIVLDAYLKTNPLLKNNQQIMFGYNGAAADENNISNLGTFHFHSKIAAVFKNAGIDLNDLFRTFDSTVRLKLLESIDKGKKAQQLDVEQGITYRTYLNTFEAIIMNAISFSPDKIIDNIGIDLWEIWAQRPVIKNLTYARRAR